MIETGTPARALILALASACVTVVGAAQPTSTWIERADLSVVGQTLAPTTAERLAAPDVLLIDDKDLIPSGNDWLLNVFPLINYGPPPSLPLCAPEEIELYYAQPRPSPGCSGFLVAPDLVLTAGHCVEPTAPDPIGTSAPYDCTERYSIVLDYADLGPVDQTEHVPLSDSQVVHCDEVIVDTHLGLATDMPESGNGDWALLRLHDDILDRLPHVIERFPQTIAGDEVLVIGHPGRLPLKAEFSVREGTAGVPFHLINGNSGSAVTSMRTGKVSQNIALGSASAWILLQGPPDNCYDFCFECAPPTATGTPSSFWAADVPPLGLQVDYQDTVIDYYGPPTIGADFDPWHTTVSVPVGSLPTTIPEVLWRFTEEDVSATAFEVVSGPSLGALDDGESTALSIRPTDQFVASPGVHEKVASFLDLTYGTREPLTHRAHVGQDGFFLFPDDDFDGIGLGVEHGAEREYTPGNRWIVFQDVTATTNAPWLEIDGDTLPVTVSIPPKYSKAQSPSLTVSTNGSSMDPGVYLGTVTFESDDSGSPEFTLDSEVVFDHCREGFPDLGNPPLPETFTLAAFGGTAERTLAITPSGGTLIEDVDVIAKVVQNVGFGEPTNSLFGVELVAPDGTTVILRHPVSAQQEIYDDDRFPLPSGEFLAEFIGVSSTGTWILRLRNDIDAPTSIDVDLKEWEVRLHHQGALPCV